MAERSVGLYGEDLAVIHHEGFGGFARDAAPGVIRFLREAGISGGRVVELGCGSGILARALLDARFRVTGIDASPAMVRLAGRVAAGAELHVASMHEFPIPPCSVVVAIGESVGYAPPGGEAADLRALIERAADALEPGGVLLFDVVLTGEGDGQRYRSWTAGEGWVVLVEVVEDTAEAMLTREIVTFREVERCYRRTTERHRCRTFVEAEVTDWLDRAGFDVRVTTSYGDHALPPGRRAFVGRLR